MPFARRTADEVKLAKGRDMIRTLAWKEYREHRAVWGLMAVCVTVAVGSLCLLRNVIGWQLWMWGAGMVGLLLAAVYGVICASMMLAGERESGTVGFLDLLCPSRALVWRTKFWAGATLTAAQAVWISSMLLCGNLHGYLQRYFVSSAHGLPPSGMLWLLGISLALAVPVLAVAVFAWSLLLSAVSRTVFGAIGYAGLSLILICGMVVSVLWRGGITPVTLLTVLVLVALPATVALFSSRWLYAHADLERECAEIPIPAWLTILWLTLRQARRVVMPVLALAVVLGVVLPWLGELAWSPALVLLGVLCGVAVFGGEESRGWQRFLGDQRAPLWSVGIIKAGFWMIVATAFIALVENGASGIVSMAKLSFYSLGGIAQTTSSGWDGLPLHAWYVPQSGRSVAAIYTAGPLALWLAYGFSFGFLGTLLHRKMIVAVLLAFLLSVFFLALWAPSLAKGGVKWWQLAGVPGLILLLSLRLLRPWANDRLQDRHAFLSLSGGGFLILLWMAGNFAYRALEYPAVPAPYDVNAFRASMPTGPANEAGHLIVDAVNSLPEQETAARGEVGPLTASPFGAGPIEGAYVHLGEAAAHIGDNEQPPYSYIGQVELAVIKGWPSSRNDKLNRWLDITCEGKWLQQIKEAASLPVGVIDDPALKPLASGYRQRWKYEHLTQILLARALQLQARGQTGAALDVILWTLAYANNLRHRAVMHLYDLGDNAEYGALTVLYRWLGHPGLQRAELWRALKALYQHEHEIPPPAEAVEADYVAATELWADPSKVFALAGSDTFSEVLRLEVRLLAHSIPWERERSWRRLNLHYAREKADVSGARHRTLVQVTELLVALVLYEAEHGGNPAPRLAALVPDELPEIPHTAGGPTFDYSVFDKETVVAVNRLFSLNAEAVRVPAGSSVIQTAGQVRTASYLVPRWQSGRQRTGK